jgi:hypothetical protein
VRVKLQSELSGVKQLCRIIDNTVHKELQHCK